MLFNGPIHSFDYPHGFFSEAVEERTVCWTFFLVVVGGSINFDNSNRDEMVRNT